MSAYALVGGKQKEYALQAGARPQAQAHHLRGLGHRRRERPGRQAPPLVKNVDYLLMNEHELYLVTAGLHLGSRGDLRDMGVEQLIVKVGEMGSIVITPELNELVERTRSTALSTPPGRRLLHRRVRSRRHGGHDLISARAWPTWPAP